MSEPNQTVTLPRRGVSGDPVDPLPPSIHPSRTTLSGRYARVEPIDPRLHAEALYQAGHSDDRTHRIWDYMPYGPFTSLEQFQGWLRDRAASADPLFFVVSDQARGRLEGMASLMDIHPQAGAIEVGHIWFAPALQRSRAATEALYLLMSHTLDELGYRRLQWKCNALNQASRDAALRLGFDFEGVLYQQQIPKGHNRDTAYYSILDYEWPLIRRNFERWLSPENFDEAGRQRSSLGQMNRALRP